MPPKKSNVPKKKARLRRTYRRELGGLLFFLLSLSSFLGLFQVRALFVDFFTDICQRLFGSGFFLVPFGLLFMAIVLAFHQGRPVRSRLFCALFSLITVSALSHLFFTKTVYTFDARGLSALWAGASLEQNGGILGGLVAMLFSFIFSRIGAIILCILLSIVFLFSAFQISFSALAASLVAHLRARRDENRLRREAMAEEAERTRASEPIERRVPAAVPPMESRRARKPKTSYDVPVDDYAMRRVDIPVDGYTPPSDIPDGKGAPRAGVSEASPQTADASSSGTTSAVTPGFAFPSEAPFAASTSPIPAPQPDAFAASPTVTDVAVSFGREPESPPDQLYARSPETSSLPDVDAPRPARASHAMSDRDLFSDVAEQNKPYRFPPPSLLTKAKPGSAPDATAELNANAARLLETIRSFGIDARIISVVRGPSVTRFELELERGIKLSRLTGLSDDIALSLGAMGVRIAPIPDKMSVVGIEVPNKIISTVYIRDVLSSPEFSARDAKLSFAIGKDISGACIVGDLSKMTHLLIAGTTGSGKSVCMNSLIVSLLYKASPDEVRLIMIDPKMVELGIYNGIPHLELPVVTDPKKAAGALQWAVVEMERRYRKFMETRVRDIFSYNQHIKGDPELAPMPQMVIIIDELADLMLVAAKEVEESICRLAQKARAAGMHLVVATQRPSADVITGLMKANIPSRIAFAVASQLESRIILDTGGAEKLVGRGDMLLLPLGAPKPTRVQGCLISGAEVEAVVEHIKPQTPPAYSQEILEEIEKNAEGIGRRTNATAARLDEDDDWDDMLEAAIDIVLETGQASVSYLQRRLKLGFSRAARIVDQMEKRGIVGPSLGSKPRAVLVSSDAVRGHGTPPDEAPF